MLPKKQVFDIAPKAYISQSSQWVNDNSTIPGAKTPNLSCPQFPQTLLWSLTSPFNSIFKIHPESGPPLTFPLPLWPKPPVALTCIINIFPSGLFLPLYLFSLFAQSYQNDPAKMKVRSCHLPVQNLPMDSTVTHSKKQRPIVASSFQMTCNRYYCSHFLSFPMLLTLLQSHQPPGCALWQDDSKLQIPSWLPSSFPSGFYTKLPSPWKHPSQPCLKLRPPITHVPSPAFPCFFYTSPQYTTFCAYLSCLPSLECHLYGTRELGLLVLCCISQYLTHGEHTVNISWKSEWACNWYLLCSTHDVLHLTWEHPLQTLKLSFTLPLVPFNR